jgi:hypothetical protein
MTECDPDSDIVGLKSRSAAVSRRALVLSFVPAQEGRQRPT